MTKRIRIPYRVPGSISNKYLYMDVVVAGGVASPSGVGAIAGLTNATHTAAIDPSLLADGALSAATCGTFGGLIGAGAESVSVSSGRIVQANGAAGAAYITLICDDVIQRLTAKIQWPADATGVIAFAVPASGGSFPGGDGGAGAPNAGIHGTIGCMSAGVPATITAMGAYGPDAEVIPTEYGEDLVSTMPLQGTTRTFEILVNKSTGRVTVSLDSWIVIDYRDTRVCSYLSPYAVFEFYPSGAGSMPKLVSIEASSVYKEPSSESMVLQGGLYLASPFALTSDAQDTGLYIKGAHTPMRRTVVTASVWLDQTSGDTYFRLTDGVVYSADQKVATGAFHGRVTYFEILPQTVFTPQAVIKLQARNTDGAASLANYASVGWHKLVSTAVML